MKPFDKYDYYRRAVQSPEVDVQFMHQAFRELRGRAPRTFREDFCGTFALCCAWVEKHRENRAIGIDLDSEPIAYGREHNLSELKLEQQRRIQILQGSVLTAETAKVDVVAAFNFSYYLFKSRLMLRRYFQRARRALKRDGVFLVDCFGGPDCQGANEETSKIGGFKYFWEQEGFDPISHEAMFHIHFRRPGERKREKVFTYDWRLWTIPEIREVMAEAGFRRSHVYWEGTTRSGKGNGKFKRVSRVDEECESWVAYILAEP